MAIKFSEVKELSQTELLAKASDFRKELFNLKLQKASSQLEKPSRLRDLRRGIARIETQLTALRDQAINQEFRPCLKRISNADTANSGLEKLSPRKWTRPLWFVSEGVFATRNLRKSSPFSANAMPMTPRAKQSLEIRSGFRKPALFPKRSAGD